MTEDEKKLIQARHRLEAVQARNRQKERKARTRRLIQEGAILESVWPEILAFDFLNLNSRYPIGIRGCGLFRDSRKKREWRTVKGNVEYRSPICKARICRESPFTVRHFTVL